MTNTQMRLNGLFTDESFLRANENCGSFEEILCAVRSREPDVSREELDGYLTCVSRMMDGEISDEDLDCVSGGVTFLGACAAITAAVGALSALYGASKEIGKAIYYMTH